MLTAIFPGSFDPITKGHIEILKTASKMFDKVIVAVSENVSKQSFLSYDVREKLIKDCLSGIQNIEVTSYQGLTVNFALKSGAEFIIRGIRNAKDYEYEKELLNINYALNENIKTIFIPANESYSSISSSAVREILYHKGDISKFVPENVEKYLKQTNL